MPGSRPLRTMRNGGRSSTARSRRRERYIAIGRRRYSVGAALMRRGYQRERLPRFDRIPSSKLGVIPLIVRFAARGRSVAVFSEGLGGQKHHGRVVILINE